MDDLRTSVRRTWAALGGAGLVVAVSGGPDSVALLRALMDVRADASVPLVVAHLNHQLRGDASDADEAFVRTLHDDVVTHRLDVAALARVRHDNLEATAREARYRWLADVARQRQLRFVATGHTADDQAETVLHRLLRGTGLDGLRGIAGRRPLSSEVEVVRPLLRVTREQILAYLDELGQPARFDETNQDVRYTRNRIRHDLLPLLARDYNPRVVETLTRLADQASEAAEEETQAAAVLLAEAERPRAGSMVVLDADVLRRASRRLARAALRLVWRREGWSLARMGFAEFERLADLIHADAGAYDLPGGVHARLRGSVLQLSPSSRASEGERGA